MLTRVVIGGDSDTPPLTPDAGPVWGSPIIGVEVLNSFHALAAKCGIELCTNAILIEERNSNFIDLLDSLQMAGFSDRIRKTSNFDGLTNGEIAVVNGDSVTLGDGLVRYTQARSKFAFYFLDPYGPKGIPLTFVSKIVRPKRHDVMINMPYQDLHKKSGLISKLDSSDEEHKIVRNYDDMFGNTSWHKVVEELELEGLFEELAWDPTEGDDLSVSDKVRELKTELYLRKLSGIEVDTSPKWQHAKELELRLINEYKDSLCSSAPELTVKSIGLRFPDKERTIYYLYLTTHDPNGALAMNDALWEAGYQEHELRWKFRSAQEFAKRRQLSMFGDVAPLLPKRERMPKEQIAEQLSDLFSGKTLTRRQIYSALADQPFFASEIDSVLKYLRKAERASFEDPLKNSTLIIFSAH